MDIDDEETELVVSPQEWSFILGEPCPNLQRNVQEFSQISSSSAEAKRQRIAGYRPFGAPKWEAGSKEQDIDAIVKSRKLKKISDSELTSQCKRLLEQLKEMNVQHTLNGLQNVWIVKPAGKSRGRGIQCLNDLDEIMDDLRSHRLHISLQMWVGHTHM